MNALTDVNSFFSVLGGYLSKDGVMAVLKQMQATEDQQEALESVLGGRVLVACGR